MDNEASPNARIDSAIVSLPSALHLIHFRCGCHTLELMIESVVRSSPWMPACLEKPKGITNTIRNYNEFCKELDAMKKANNLVPSLVLFLTSNSPKWSSGFLLTCRAFQLRQYIDITMANTEYTSD